MSEYKVLKTSRAEAENRHKIAIKQTEYFCILDYQLRLNSTSHVHQEGHS